MQLSDLLNLLHEDFAAEEPNARAHVVAWRADTASGADHAKGLRDYLQRTAQACEMIGLAGFAAYIAQIDEYVARRRREGVLVRDEALAWLADWSTPALAYLVDPASKASVKGVIDFLRACPEPTDDAALAVLADLLGVAPSLPEDLEDESHKPIAPATAQDVSLDTTDLDGELFAAFLNDAPQQVERLSLFAQKLVKDGLEAGELTEAQRIAHTFKGSGNIIGLPGIGRMAHRVEDIFDYAIERRAEGEPIPAEMARDAALGIDCMAQMVGYLQGQDARPPYALSALQRLLDWVSAIHSGEPEEFKPPAIDQAAQADTSTSDTPQDAAPAMLPAAAGTDALRTSGERLSRMMRRAGQALVSADRFGQLTRNAMDRITGLQTNHSELLSRLRDLELSVDRQVVALNEKKDAGEGFDPLEMDRYSNLHTMTRAIVESVQDEVELTRQARTEAERALASLRDHGQNLRDQHRELIAARLVPVKTVVSRLRRNIAQTAAATGKSARLEVVGEATTLDSDVLQRLTEPLLHLLRNAVDHGIEPEAERAILKKPPQGVVTLSFERVGQEVRLICADDGRGLDLMAIYEKAVGFGLIPAQSNMPDAEIARLILRAGFSTRDTISEVSGRGVGLDVVADRINALSGRLDIDYQSGKGTRFVMHIPVSTGSVQGMVVRCEGEVLALAANQVITGLAGTQGSVSASAAGAPMLNYNDTDYKLYSLAQWLGFEVTAPTLLALHQRPKLIVRGANGPLVVAVDEILEARELILQEMGSLLRRVPGVTAVSLRADGTPLFLLDIPTLERSVLRPANAKSTSVALRRRLTVQRTPVLVVDDALSVRKAMQQMLEDAGFEAIMAVDGVNAIEKLRTRLPAMVITDLEMPNLNGIELTRRIREVPDWLHLPVVMITSRATEKHRDLALQTGVDVYMTKPYTDIDLLANVRRMTAANTKR